MTLPDFMLEWLSFKRVSLEVSTYEAYYVYIIKHINPYFEGKELEDLSSFDIQHYIIDKIDHGRVDGTGGLSRISVKKHIQILREALDQAAAYGLIKSNPSANVRVPKEKKGVKSKIVFLGIDDARRLLDAFLGKRLYPMVLITLLYGLRRSEVLGITWSSVDFINDRISITCTVVKNLSIIEKQSTKNDTSLRNFYLFPEVKDELLKLKKAQEVYKSFRLAASLPYYSSDYVFTWEDGRLYRPDYVYKRFIKDLKSLGFEKMRFHDLRHSTASILFDRGWDIKDVQQWLGHADSSTTANIYVHYGRARSRLVASDLQDIFFGSSEECLNSEEKRKNAR